MKQQSQLKTDQSFLERGGAWVVVQAILMLGVLGLALEFHCKRRSLGLLIAGTVCIGAGAAIGIAGALALRKSLTPFPKPLPNAHLVRNGIYSQIRHPLYTSVILGLVGWAMIRQSWPAILMACGLIPFFVAKARHEEGFLCDRFPEYADYSKSTKRFFPRVY